MPSRIKTIRFPVLNNFTVIVEFTGDIKKSLLRREETRQVEIEDGVGGLAVHRADRMRSFVFLKHDSTIGDVTHECWHAIRHMMNHLGIALDSETVAYHLGYLVQKVSELRMRKVTK